MIEAAESGPADEAADEAAVPARETRAPLWRWLAEGWRAGFLLRPGAALVNGATPTPAQVAAVFLGCAALQIGLAWFEFAQPVRFDVHGWLAPYWLFLPMLWIAWWVFPGNAGRAGRVAAWFMLWLLAMLPVSLAWSVFGVATARQALPAAVAQGPAAWALYLALWAWLLGATLRLAWCFTGSARRLLAFAVVLLCAYGTLTWQFTDRPWEIDPAGEAADDKPRLELTQETFEAQQALWKRSVDAIAPQRPGVTDVYGIVFAPYGWEDVFLRESTMVADVLARRFDAAGRTLHLANHATTAATLPWATPLNLERAIDAVAGRMDRDHDVLVLYLTSHGASNFRLAAANGPLTVPPLTPQALRQALDASGIRNRVIVISACYAGGWIDALASDSTLVMTAADATHTSYGCGSRSELTFFGRAMFDEQLRKTHSFTQAFEAAVPVIRKREDEAGKTDGFSNPQMRMGAAIAPVLDALAKRLDAKP